MEILYQKWMYRPMRCIETAQIFFSFYLCVFCTNKICQVADCPECHMPRHHNLIHILVYHGKYGLKWGGGGGQNLKTPR